MQILTVLALYFLNWKQVKGDITGGSFFKNKILKENAIRVYEKVGPKQCIRLCMYNNDCKAINFRRNQLKCTLLRGNIDGDIDAHLVEENGVDFAFIERWTQKEDSCWPVNPCRTQQQCIPSSMNKPICTNYVTPCTSGPCVHGYCDISESSYVCICKVGYSGTNCEITPCTSGPCRNNGTCQLAGSSYTCTCQPGYSGSNCEITPCTSGPCRNNGTCQISGSSYTCKCQTGYSGTNCEITPCTSGPCRNGGTCQFAGYNYTCMCPQCCSGTNCETSPCTSGPCTYGNCYVSGCGYSCMYSYGFILERIDTITSRNYPYDYVNNDMWATTYSNQAGHRILVRFINFDSEPCCDFFKAYDGMSTSAPLIAKVSGFSTQDVVSSGGSLYITWQTDYSNVRPGWYAEVYRVY